MSIIARWQTMTDKEVKNADNKRRNSIGGKDADLRI